MYFGYIDCIYMGMLQMALPNIVRMFEIYYFF